MIRLDSAETPTRYPVFIRSEDNCFGPETGLLQDEAAFHAAVADLRAAGKPVKRRVSISYEGAPDATGHFRKYGIIRIGDHIVPQHLLYNRNWVVSSSPDQHSDEFVAEELAFIRDNPHRDLARRAFDTGDL